VTVKLIFEINTTKKLRESLLVSVEGKSQALLVLLFIILNFSVFLSSDLEEFVAFTFNLI